MATQRHLAGHRHRHRHGRRGNGRGNHLQRERLYLCPRPLPCGSGAYAGPATATLESRPGEHCRSQGEANGIITIQSVVVTDNPIVAGEPATATVQLIFAVPLPDDYYTLTIGTSSLVDPAGNELDGVSNASQPNGGPTFPSGNGIARQQFRGQLHGQ